MSRIAWIAAAALSLVLPLPAEAQDKGPASGLIGHFGDYAVLQTGATCTLSTPHRGIALLVVIAFKGQPALNAFALTDARFDGLSVEQWGLSLGGTAIEIVDGSAKSLEADAPVTALLITKAASLTPGALVLKGDGRTLYEASFDPPDEALAALRACAGQ